ncbi:MAG: bacillithiol biosynthesis cysteine-adding enzyme BshC [Flavipsychrobacter sp.]
MPSDCIYIPYQDTHSFSKLVLDYQNQIPDLQPFYQYSPSKEGIAKAIEERSKYPTDRVALVDTLHQQYKDLTPIEAVTKNIASLADEHTYTICTAHQPNLLTGYLYFIYKILHAVKLAEELNKSHPNKHFVPVYYMGSEDNDLEELGVFRYEGERYTWDGNGQTGAVGRMNTESLKPLLDNLFRVLGPPSKTTDELKELLQNAYLKQPTIGKATQYIVHELFGRYGLVVIDPDVAIFKKNISSIIEDDLLQHTAKELVEQQVKNITDKGYKSQAYPRDINLFYMKDDIRERIEKEEDKWIVVNTNISFSEKELLEELDKHPKRLSPNVILRGLLQETMLPNVAFIGGGAEVAYWLQLKEVFSHYKVFYPVILQRQSAMWIKPKYKALRQKLGLSIEDLFKPTLILEEEEVQKNTVHNWQTAEEQKEANELLNKLKQKAIAIDTTLGASAEAALAKISKQLTVLEKKMLRAEKRKLATTIGRIHQLKEGLFPKGGLQERIDNFIDYYPTYGDEFLDQLKEGILPYNEQFLIIEDED